MPSPLHVNTTKACPEHPKNPQGRSHLASGTFQLFSSHREKIRHITHAGLIEYLLPSIALPSARSCNRVQSQTIDAIKKTLHAELQTEGKRHDGACEKLWG
jgi:hypothetical protein